VKAQRVMANPARSVFFAGLMLLCVTGCSTRAWYDGLQQSARSACQQQPSSEQARCEARLKRQDYDDYEKARAAGRAK